MNNPKSGGFTKEALVSFLGLYFSLSVTSSVAQETEEIEEIEVIGITPTHGVGVPEAAIPTNVQRATSDDLDRSQSLDLTEFMKKYRILLLYVRNTSGAIRINQVGLLRNVETE